MKNSYLETFLLSIILLFGVMINTNSTYAQSVSIPDRIVIQEALYDLNGVQRNGYQVIVAGDLKGISKKLKEQFKNDYSLKMSSKGNKLLVKDVLATKLSDKHFTLTAQLSSEGSENKLVIWMNFGTDIYVNSNEYSIESNRVQSFMRSFVVNYLDGFIQKQIDIESESIAKVEKDVSGLDKTISKQESKEAKARSAAAKAKAKQAKYESKILDLNNQLSEQKKSEEESLKEAEKLKEQSTVVKTERKELTTTLSEMTSELNKLKEQSTKLNTLK